MKSNGRSNVDKQTRQAGPSEIVGAIHELPLPVDRFRGRGKTPETAPIQVEPGLQFNPNQRQRSEG